MSMGPESIAEIGASRELGAGAAPGVQPDADAQSSFGSMLKEGLIVGAGLLTIGAEASADHAPHPVLDGKKFGYPDNPSGLLEEGRQWEDCLELAQRGISRIEHAAIGEQSGDLFLTVSRQPVPKECNGYVERQGITFRAYTRIPAEKVRGQGHRAYYKTNELTKTTVNNKGRESYRVRMDGGECAEGRTMLVRLRAEAKGQNFTHPPQDAEEARKLKRAGISPLPVFGEIHKKREARFGLWRVKCPSVSNTLNR